MKNVIWFSNRTNTVGRTVETKYHSRLKDAIAEIADSGYVERQEWEKNGKILKSQSIHAVVNFKPSAQEARAIESRITVPFQSLSLRAKSLH